MLAIRLWLGFFISDFDKDDIQAIHIFVGDILHEIVDEAQTQAFAAFLAAEVGS